MRRPYLNYAPGSAKSGAMAHMKLLAIDDHPIVLSGLRMLFERHPDIRYCGEAATAAAARALAAELRPDLIVIDLVLGGDDGIALIRAMLAIVPDARILVYSSHDEKVWARHAQAAGAHGYVAKAEPLDAVAHALDLIVAGEPYFSRSTSERPGDADELAGLSARELQVLTLLGEGRSLRDMGVELGLSVKTVGTYRERLKVKLGLDRTRLLELYAADRLAGLRVPQP